MAAVFLAALACALLLSLVLRCRSAPAAYGDGGPPLMSSGARFGVLGAPIDPSIANRPSPSPQPEGDFQRAAQEALRAAPLVEHEPVFRPPDEALAPAYLWRPSFQGVQSTFVDAPCLAHRPSPRLWATSLEELRERRARLLGATYPEPLRNRQAWLQLLTYDWRSRRDLYTRASAGNSFEVHRACDDQRPLPLAGKEPEGPAPAREGVAAGPIDEATSYGR